jgi:hypothetical protein
MFSYVVPLNTPQTSITVTCYKLHQHVLDDGNKKQFRTTAVAQAASSYGKA